MRIFTHRALLIALVLTLMVTGSIIAIALDQQAALAEFRANEATAEAFDPPTEIRLADDIGVEPTVSEAELETEASPEAEVAVGSPTPTATSTVVLPTATETDEPASSPTPLPTATSTAVPTLEASPTLRPTAEVCYVLFRSESGDTYRTNITRSTTFNKGLNDQPDWLYEGQDMTVFSSCDLMVDGDETLTLDTNSVGFGVDLQLNAGSHTISIVHSWATPGFAIWPQR